jgi:hypothetical protein
MATRGLLAALLIACGTAAPVCGQSAWTDRGYVAISGDMRVSPMTFTGISHPIDFVETATVSTTYDVKPAPGLDAAFGVRVWRNLAIGVDASWTTKSASGSIEAQIPHPFTFNKPRSVSGDSNGLDHDETAVHLQAVWMIPARPRWSIAIAAGPSWIIVDQRIVKDITISSAYPFDTAAYASAVSDRVTKGRLGFNAGGDVAYMLRPRAGVGFGVNFSRARVPLPNAAGETVSINAGGLRVGGGLRVRF